jgi:alkylation response protein AidB-like acyl-CoA dehydrogenase|tara:strand:+ start:115 stop:273 length:159 start_codon:yes stop_codon:yes gene_type:complete
MKTAVSPSAATYSKEFPIENHYLDAPMMCVTEGINEMRLIIVLYQTVSRDPT